MKICIIHNLYEPYARGGAEQVVKATIDFLLSLGHEVVLITATPEKEKIVEKSGLKIFYLKQNNIFSYFELSNHNFLTKFVWHILNIFNFAIAKKVFEILQEEKIELVHTHNLMGLSFLIPKKIRKLKIKHIHTVHDVQLVEPSGIIIKNKENSWRYKCLLMQLNIWLMKKMIGSPDLVISPSQFLLDFYKGKGYFGKSELKSLANPLTLNIQNNFVKEKHNGFNFLYLGQIEKHKGIFELLAAFSKIKNATLYVVGDGVSLPELKNRFVDLENVIFYGSKSREELVDIFAKMDVMIFPSLCYENYPAVIFESLFFEVPVLSVNHSSLPEFIKEGKNGWFFDIGKEDDLLEKIKYCIENKEEVDVISKKIGDNKKSFKENNLSLLFDEYKKIIS